MQLGKWAFLTVSLVVSVLRDVERWCSPCVLWSFRELTLLICLLHQHLSSICSRPDPMLRSGIVSKRGSSLGSFAVWYGGIWHACPISLLSSLMFPCQDHEEAVLVLLEGAAWEEALRLVRGLQNSLPEVLSRTRACTGDTVSAGVPGLLKLPRFGRSSSGSGLRISSAF